MRLKDLPVDESPLSDWLNMDSKDDEIIKTKRTDRGALVHYFNQRDEIGEKEGRNDF